MPRSRSSSGSDRSTTSPYRRKWRLRDTRVGASQRQSGTADRRRRSERRVVWNRGGCESRRRDPAGEDAAMCFSWAGRPCGRASVPRAVAVDDPVCGDPRVGSARGGRRDSLPT